MDSARALIARGWGVSLVSRCLRVSRAQLHVILRRTDDWMDGRRGRHTDDADVLLRIHHVIGELPTYGYRRVVSTTDEKWLFRNLGGDFHASGLMTLCLSSSNPARPYIWRFNIFRRFT